MFWVGFAIGFCAGIATIIILSLMVNSGRISEDERRLQRWERHREAFLEAFDYDRHPD